MSDTYLIGVDLGTMGTKAAIFNAEGKLIAEGAPQEIIESTGCHSLEDAFLVLARRGGSDAN